MINEQNIGETFIGQITDLIPYGAVVTLNDHQKGFLHISEVSYDYVQDIFKVLTLNQTVTVKVISYDFKNDKIGLSMKQLLPPLQKKEAFKEEISLVDVDASTLLNNLPRWINNQLKKEGKYA